MNLTCKTHWFCAICDTPFKEPLYEKTDAYSITSLGELLPAQLRVFLCHTCGHLQTQELDNLEAYYDKAYNILVNSEEEDQVYRVDNEKKIFRIEHQVQTFLTKLHIPENARVLDYGCAKSATMKNLSKIRPDIVPYLFDVSDVYVPFWKNFAQPENWALYSPKADWQESMDVVTSFFSLEHVPNPRQVLTLIHSLLKPGGVLYALVPNVLANYGDFIVLDHVHHYTESSLRYLLISSGFEEITVELNAHEGAFLVMARKSLNGFKSPVQEQCPLLQEAEKILKIQQYWEKIDTRIQSFEETYRHLGRAAIYGAGFWGTYIASRLKDLSWVDCFVDQNPYLQGKTKFEKPIVSPEQLEQPIKLIYVGLNPNVAQQAIGQIQAFQERSLQYLFL